MCKIIPVLKKSREAGWEGGSGANGAEAQDREEGEIEGR